MHTETDIDETAQMTEPDKLGYSNGVRIGQDLIRATAPFAEEDVTKSWWLVGSTFTLLIAALTGAAMVPWWPVPGARVTIITTATSVNSVPQVWAHFR